MAVMDKAQRASGYALDLNTAIGEELVAVSTKLQNLDFSDLFSQLSEIDDELAKGTLKPDDIREAQAARQELEGVFANGIRDTKGKLRQGAARLVDKTAELTGVVLAERTREVLSQHQERQPAIIQAIADKRAAWKALDADRAKIIAAQDVIRSRNIADVIKDFIPKDLEKLDLKKPEVEAIKMGVEVLKKILGEVSEGFKYSDLADQRLSFDNKIAKLDGEIQDLIDEQTKNDLLVEDLKAVMSVDDKRDAVAAEANKLTTAFSGFADALDKLNGSAVTEASVNRLLGTIKSYVGNCLSARNKVIIV